MSHQRRHLVAFWKDAKQEFPSFCQILCGNFLTPLSSSWNQLIGISVFAGVILWNVTSHIFFHSNSTCRPLAVWAITSRNQACECECANWNRLLPVFTLFQIIGLQRLSIYAKLPLMGTTSSLIQLLFPLHLSDLLADFVAACSKRNPIKTGFLVRMAGQFQGCERKARLLSELRSIYLDVYLSIYLSI